MYLKEQKGDVFFYENEKGQLFQQLGFAEPYKVKNGKITYRTISTHKGIVIKYQNNGCNGFSLFKGKTLLEDNIWEFSEAQRIATTLN